MKEGAAQTGTIPIFKENIHERGGSPTGMIPIFRNKKAHLPGGKCALYNHVL